MARKTVKDLDCELNKLKKELIEMKTKLSELTEKNNISEKNNEENHSNKNNKCNSCDADFLTPSELKRHVNSEHRDDHGKYECEVCEKMFEEEWKFKAHTKSHKLFPCEKCDKSFKQAGAELCQAQTSCV